MSDKYHAIWTAAVRNVALEDAALQADKESERLDALATEHSASVVLSEGLKGGARAARRIARKIRELKASEEEG